MSETILPFHATDEALDIIKGLIPGLEECNDEADPTIVILVGEDEHAYLHRKGVGTMAIERDLCDLNDAERIMEFLQALLKNPQTEWSSMHRLYEEHVHTAVSFGLLDGSIDPSPGPRNFEVCETSETPLGICLWAETVPMTSEFSEAQDMLDPIGMPHHIYEKNVIPEMVRTLTGTTERVLVIAKSLNQGEGFLIEINDPDPVTLMALEARRHG